MADEFITDHSDVSRAPEVTQAVLAAIALT